MAVNNGGTSRNLTYKIFAILKTSNNIVKEEREVLTGSLDVLPNDTSTARVELDTFKAADSTINVSWNKNCGGLSSTTKPVKKL